MSSAQQLLGQGGSSPSIKNSCPWSSPTALGAPRPRGCHVEHPILLESGLGAGSRHCLPHPSRLSARSDPGESDPNEAFSLKPLNSCEGRFSSLKKKKRNFSSKKNAGRCVEENVRLLLASPSSAQGGAGRGRERGPISAAVARHCCRVASGNSLRPKRCRPSDGRR